MKTYIPKQPKQVRERIEAKLDVRLVERLERYCQYLESDRDFLVSWVALDFRSDLRPIETIALQQPAYSLYSVLYFVVRERLSQIELGGIRQLALARGKVCLAVHLDGTNEPLFRSPDHQPHAARRRLGVHIDG